MKRFFLLVFLFLFPAVSYSQPSIVFDEENHDFGTVNKSDSIERDFDFTNKGDEDLTIGKLVPS
jgi:hypothetical protein